MGASQALRAEAGAAIPCDLYETGILEVAHQTIAFSASALKLLRLGEPKIASSGRREAVTHRHDPDILRPIRRVSDKQHLKEGTIFPIRSVSQMAHFLMQLVC